MQRPLRLPYEFSEYSIDHYYQYYFQKKHIDEENNLAILAEIVAVSLGTEESLKLLEETVQKRIEIFNKSETSYEFVYRFFHEKFIFSILTLSEEYNKLFESSYPKKLLWDDLVYKLKFKHLHSDLNYDFPNPYENSNELIF